jgi:hypothetical protein
MNGKDQRELLDLDRQLFGKVHVDERLEYCLAGDVGDEKRCEKPK